MSSLCWCLPNNAVLSELSLNVVSVLMLTQQCCPVRVVPKCCLCADAFPDPVLWGLQPCWSNTLNPKEETDRKKSYNSRWIWWFVIPSFYVISTADVVCFWQKKNISPTSRDLSRSGICSRIGSVVYIQITRKLPSYLRILNSLVFYGKKTSLCINSNKFSY